METTPEFFKPKLDGVINHLKSTLPRIGDGQPKIGKDDGTYELSGGHDWTDGYWASQLWLTYRYLDTAKDSRAATFRDYAERQLEILTAHYDDNPEKYDHGVGHIFMPAAAIAYELTGDESAKRVALAAADSMLRRELRESGVILAWNVSDDYKPDLKRLVSGLTIVDTMDSIPLLFWASRISGQGQYADLASRHAKKIADHIIRPDGSTFHAFQFDPDTGQPIRGLTWQGHDDQSCWSRGQSWAIHGFALAYGYTDDETFRRAAETTARYAIDNLPDDHVPYWDYKLPGNATDYRDSSAAAIMASGLLELAALTSGSASQEYREVAIAIMTSLARDYAVDTASSDQGLLYHGSSSVPDERYDTMLPYGDFFYLESLLRITEL